MIEVHAEFDPSTDLSHNMHFLEEGRADYVLILRLTVNDDEVQWTARVYETSASGPSMKIFVQEPRSHLGFYKNYIGTEGRRLLQETLTEQLVAGVRSAVDCTLKRRPRPLSRTTESAKGHSIEPPFGLAWGASWETVRAAVIGRLPRLEHQEPSDKWLELERFECSQGDGWTYAGEFGPFAGQKGVLIELLFKDGGLSLVRISPATVQGRVLDPKEAQEDLDVLWSILYEGVEGIYGQPTNELPSVIKPDLGDEVRAVWNDSDGREIWLSVRRRFGSPMEVAYEFGLYYRSEACRLTPLGTSEF